MIHLLDLWTRLVIGSPRSVLSILAILTLGAAWIAIDQFSMNSDTSRLIRQDTDWRRHHDAFVEVFPQYDRNSFVVVSGSKPATVIEVARELSNALRQHNDVFSRIELPAADPFVDQHALMFLPVDELEDTVSRLAEAQPLLTAVKEDGLRGILTLMTDALNSDEPLPAGFDQMTTLLEKAMRNALASESPPIAWRDELLGNEADKTFYQVIFVQGRQDFGKELPNRMIIEHLRETVATFDHPWRDETQIRLSGIVPLEHGEIESALDSAQLAGTLALLVLIAVLVWGVRSVRIVAATYLAMLCGLIWTAAFAMLVVGQFNTISIIFLVMFIGLGVDFAVHLCLKYQESLTHLDKSQALVDANHHLGPAIALCGITSAVGFLSFVPTEYVGLAEMGMISGGGMIIAVFVSLTLIPAFFALTAEPPAPIRLPLTDRLTTLISKHHRATAYSTLGLLIVLAAISTGARFDYGTLSLKDPESEAMTTLEELHNEQIITDYALLYLADDQEAARALKSSLQTIPEVGEVRIPVDYLPEDQVDKRLILEDAQFLLDPLFYTVTDETPFIDEARQASLLALSDALNNHSQDFKELSQLALSLSQATTDNRQQFEAIIVPPILGEIDWLQGAIAIDDVSFDSLPDTLKSRLVATNGKQVITITPAENVVPIEAMRRFTESVQARLPGVVGRPVIDLGVGDIVVTAFFTAITVAVSAIFLILLVTLRSIIDSVLVFIPLAMTALFTLSFSVLVDLPLNMANVIVIPLIFGLGVDNGIHIVKRFRQSANVAELAKSSTPKAVFLSNLTTLGTFFALIFASHLGIHSIGILLTVALICLMALTLVSLPALLATFSTPQR